MTLAYLGSSALVNLLVEEDGSHDARLWDGADAVVTSHVAHPEVRAALADAPVFLATWDRRLRRVARAVGLVTLPSGP